MKIQIANSLSLIFLIWSISSMKIKTKDNSINDGISIFRNLISWLQTYGAYVNDLDIKFINENNRYITAKRDLQVYLFNKAGDILAEIPLNLMISILNPEVDKFCNKLKPTMKGHNYNDACITLFLWNEATNPNSKFKPYIDSLPKSVSIVANCEDCMDLLKGSELLKYVNSYIIMKNKLFESVKVIKNKKESLSYFRRRIRKVLSL